MTRWIWMLLLLLPTGCAGMLASLAPPSDVDKAIAEGNVTRVSGYCQGNPAPPSAEDKAKACQASERFAAQDVATIEQAKCEVISGDSDARAPLQDVLYRVPSEVIARRLQACKAFDAVLRAEFSDRGGSPYRLGNELLGAMFLEGEGATFLDQALADDRGRMAAALIVNRLDPEAERMALGDKLAARPELIAFDRTFEYLVRLEHASVDKYLPERLDAEQGEDRLFACRVVKARKTRAVRARVERLAQRDPWMVVDQGAATYPVRVACAAALEAIRE
jgi:hypothetical protein